MKKPVLLLFLFSTVWGWSQNISVAEFKLLPTDLTANSYGTMVYDQNGEICALIRVQTTEKGFAFEVGSIGVTKVDDSKIGEIWVYVPKGVRKINIRHPQLGTLLDYYFPVAIESARTYLMKLTTGKVQTIVEEAVSQQYVVFKVEPKDAMLVFDGEILPLVDGQAEKFVSLGTYDYQLNAPKHHSQTGKVTISDPNNKKVLNVVLNPAYGNVRIEGTSAYGATVYIDNQNMGIAPITCSEIASGSHTLYLAKNKFKSYSQSFTVSDGQTITLTPVLEPNFAHITFMVEDGAEIWINQSLKGIGSYSDDFEAGTLLVECRKTNHRNTSRSVEVVAGAAAQTIILDSPIPITGSLNISTTPSSAIVYLDGKKMGESPMFMPKVLIGEHRIIMEKEGHIGTDTTVVVKAGKVMSVSVALRKGAVLEQIEQRVTELNMPVGDLTPYENDKGLIGYKNAEGEVVIPCKWEFAYYFSEGLARVKNTNGEYGFIDKSGKVVIPYQWEYAEDFSEGLAKVKNAEGKWGFIDKTGKVVIPCKWEFAYYFSEGKARVQNSSGEWVSIDKTGKVIE